MQSFIKIGGVVFLENASRETDGLLDLLLGCTKNGGFCF